MMISETQIRSAIRNAPASGKKSIELRDDGHRGVGRLVLLVRPLRGTVAAEWYAVYYRAGKRQTTKVGSYPALSLSDARKRFRLEYAPAISAGAEPRSAHVRRRHEWNSDTTVQDLFTAYVDSLKRAGKRSWQDIERILLSPKSGAARTIGVDRPAREIQPEDIVAHLAEIHGRGATVMARETRAYLSAAFTFGLKAAHDYTRKAGGANWGIKSNPVLAIPSDPSAVKTIDRFLAPNRFRALWLWLTDYEVRSSLAPAVRLMMITGQRVEEILRISESGYDRRERMLFWDVTKTGVPHSIPLSPLAVDILDQLRANEHGLFFACRHDPSRPALYKSLQNVVRRYCKDTGAEYFTPRDLRRTWKTLAGKAGVSKDMRDRLQNHSKGDVSSRHYDRYDYLEEKRAAMVQWASYLDRILAEAFDEQKERLPVAIARVGGSMLDRQQSPRAG